MVVDAAARGTFSLSAACFIEASGGPASEEGWEGGREGGARDNRETEKSAGRMFDWSEAVRKAPPVLLSSNTVAEKAEEEVDNIYIHKYIYIYEYITPKIGSSSC